ncbi:hypothetical protein CAPTEDRAFT_208131 [Capitella teleta]|uniref:Beta-lactamase-related domain-containing protein n=1 Tax=Capitella teleta TaxID=283909 RepID=R7UZG4_CAPTE|nr:hypothetical protein CAPTEDRAFT_208131 [Capitella teleta]|eukprot:ELU08826.1 hypothetical protein CAPTEDRAFT_208131 [Capitella teleta]
MQGILVAITTAIFFIFYSVSIPIRTKTNWDEEKEEKLNSFISAVMQCRDSAGMFISLVKDGEVAFTSGYGFRDMENQLPVTADTRFNIGSLSKAFTTALAADAISKSQNVTWDTPLKDILGDMFHLQDDFRTEEASIRDMFSHKLGMPSYWGLSTAGLDMSRREIVMDRMEHFPVRYPFRRQYLYSNYLYVIGSFATQALIGQPWEDHIKSAIFQPLGMANSRVSLDMTGNQWHNSSYSYTYVDGRKYSVNPELDQKPFLDEIAPAAGVFSTANDMAKWMIFQLNEGRNTEGDSLIPALTETHKASTVMGRESPRVQKPAFPVDDMRLTYAMGWRNGMYRGYEKLQHTGAYSSFECHLRLLPDMEIGALACVNSPGDYRGTRSTTLATAFGLDLLLDEDPWLNETTGCTYPDPWARQTPPTPVSFPVRQLQRSTRDLQEYAGTYSHEAFGEFIVTYHAENETLTYRFGILLNGELKPAEIVDDFYMTLGHPLTYRMAFFPEYPEGYPIYFGTSEEGDVVSVTVPYFESSFPPTFNKL